MAFCVRIAEILYGPLLLKRGCVQVSSQLCGGNLRSVHLAVVNQTGGILALAALFPTRPESHIISNHGSAITSSLV